MPSHLEDVPPPPYTETDIYSASARDAHGADDASRSTTSTSGDVIYTPPLTPHSSHQSNFAGEVDHGVSSAAAAYFATRPAPYLNSQSHIIHSIVLTANSSPESLPYPADFAARDVRLEDWQTFTNYLLPHHWTTTNEHIIERKLRAEAMTATDTNPGDDTRSQSSGRSHAEAHLNRIRSPVDPVDVPQRRQSIESTVREWNDGFFGPRRISIRVELEQSSPSNGGNNNNSNPPPQQPYPDEKKSPMPPGGWDPSFDQPSNNPPHENENNDEATPRRAGFFATHFGGGGRGRDRGLGRGGRSGGFRFGGINIEEDRVSIGNSFVADGRAGSLRIGGIVADGNGIRVHGQPVFPGARAGAGAAAGRGGWGPPGWGTGGGPRGFGCGRGGGPWGRGGGWGMGWGRGNWWNQEVGGEHARGRGEHRGPGERHRSRSSSASSTTSETSSVGSESSVGSLPDYDDLKDSQLPVAKRYLLEWLHRPEQHITREQVKSIKEQLKAAKHSNDPATMTFDRAALRREVKDLLRDWKQLKKQQKRTRKQLRREKKQRRRQEKRERRQVKRELKQAAREVKQATKEAKRELRRGPFGMPPMPPMPHMPHPPPPPAMPPHPAMPHGQYPFFNHHPWDEHTRGVPGARLADDAYYAAGVSDESVGPFPGTTGYAASQAKYQAAWEMEARVAEKEAELLKLHERIAQDQSIGGGTSGEEKGQAAGPSKMEAEAAAVEREIDELAREMERLRTEADEEFARELAAEEEKAAR
ncbi:hypothetical protein C7999DRAFT_13007 [Corynascus novoguineensis]|uniref:Uncharacterized protein n=1 Tax=Corynascus novoguineensis TaxID=1126955 RepID=A0AAN7HGM0_9PEZI|nr:hypothetical protein C7999DRAFT_13007 [Corynascus novoguineensis]